MTRYLLCAFALVVVMGQVGDTQSVPPPNAFPVQNRFVRLGYDLNLNIPNDLATPNPSTASGANNGILFALPSRQMVLNTQSKMWEGEVGTWTGSSYVWTRIIDTPSAVGFYPDVAVGDPDMHDWLFTPPGSTFTLRTVFYGSGIFTCYGYDGNLAIPGDLLPGSGNGVLFALPAQNVHLILDLNVWHLQLYLSDTATTKNFYWAVYPQSRCAFQPS